ncbi:hypothetical protein INR49_004614 [Caranx melampygus]|nr:hypothetical protein INR49_004614 [Caranx melampygus]
MGFSDLLEESELWCLAEKETKQLFVTLLQELSSFLHVLCWFKWGGHLVLKAFIPLDSSGNRLDRCRRYVEPQWHLLSANNSVNTKVEWIPTKARTLVGTLTSFFFTFGQMILAGLAYWLRDWRKLQVVVCAPQFVFFACSWWYSESARWLVLNRRSEDALKSLHRVARINGKPEMADKLTLEVLNSHMNKEIESSRESFTAYDLLRSRGMRRISICLIAVWFSTSFAYYGLAMDLQKFGVNIYLMQIIFGAVDFPAKLLALGMLSYFGRRVSQAPVSSCQPSSSLPTSLSPQVTSFTSASFTTVYLYTGELYPTVIRQTGMGFVSTMARVGSMAAPAVLILDEVLPALPSIVYGGAAVLAGCFACFLPETLNVPLPDTIDDVEEKWSGRNPTPDKKKVYPYMRPWSPATMETPPGGDLTPHRLGRNQPLKDDVSPH